MHKYLRSASVLFLALLVCLQAGLPPVMAAGIIGEPAEGIRSANPNFAQGSIRDNFGGMSIEALYYIKDGTCSIANLGSGKVSIGGKTTTYYSVDTVSVVVYLQQYDGMRWVDVYYVQDSRANSNLAEVLSNVTVDRGYNYRTRAVHTAKNGTVTETASSMSSYIFVN